MKMDLKVTKEHINILRNKVQKRIKEHGSINEKELEEMARDIVK